MNKVSIDGHNKAFPCSTKTIIIIITLVQTTCILLNKPLVVKMHVHYIQKDIKALFLFFNAKKFTFQIYIFERERLVLIYILFHRSLLAYAFYYVMMRYKMFVFCFFCFLIKDLGTYYIVYAIFMKKS